MAQIIVRNIDENIKNQLAMNAQLNGHSMEEEVRQIIKKSVSSKQTRFGTELTRYFKDASLDFEILEHKGFQTRNPFED
jgi:plasmid stability protein